MKVIYNTLSLIAIILLNSCAQGDKKVDATPTTDGPNVIIDSGNIGGGGPLEAGNSNQSLVVPQQEKTAQVSSQNIQMTPAQMQQIQQQAIQNQQIQQPLKQRRPPIHIFNLLRPRLNWECRMQETWMPSKTILMD